MATDECPTVATNAHAERRENARSRVVVAAKLLALRGPQSSAWGPFLDAVWKLEEIEQEADDGR